MKRHLRGRDAQAPKGHCRWCQKPVPPPRRTWCSDACVEEYLVRSSAAHARRRVLERDRGICAACGLDCAALEKALRAARPCAWLVGPPPREIIEVMGPLGFRVAEMQPCQHLWEADHVVPVVEGGGGCGLDNLRTLCLPCHKAETAALAARRAQQPKAAPPAPTRQLSLIGGVP